MVRLGAVSYLNVQPLVAGLDSDPDVSLRFDVPSVCARLLNEGAIDLGMVPSITWLDRPGDRIVPGVCIGSEGPVASVALFTRRDMTTVRTVALDASSRTSAALVRILCRRYFAIDPVFLTQPPDVSAMLAKADAALLIGDPALFLDYRALGLQKIDLGALWSGMTGLPFVWAFWSGREDAASEATVRRLQVAAAQGARSVDAIAAAYCRGATEREPVARRYLRDHMSYGLGPREVEGLRTYFQEVAALGLVTGGARDPVFFPVPPDEASGGFA
jgi:predicted solute-binding protein